MEAQCQKNSKKLINLYKIFDILTNSKNKNMIFSNGSLKIIDYRLINHTTLTFAQTCAILALPGI